MATRTGYGGEDTVPPRRYDSGSGAWAWIVGGVLFLLLLALFIIPAVYDPAEGATAGPNAGATLCDVTDEPAEFYGDTVTISGMVSEVKGPNAFVLGGEEFIGGCRVLVVGARPVTELLDDVEIEGREPTAPITEGDVVQVSGTMRQFQIAEIEQAIGPDLDDALFDEFQGQPALVAQQIFLNPRAARAAEPAGQGQATLADISDNPEEFFGDTVTVDGVVAETVDPRVFVIVRPGDETLAEGEFDQFDRGVLVANTRGTSPNLREGQTVQVAGEVRQFDVAEFEQAIGTQLEDGALAGWGARPAILADSVKTK